MAEPSTSHPPESSTASAPCCPKIRAWLQLMRVANLPTAISNVLAGYIVTTSYQRDVSLSSGCMSMILASCLLYCGGMILNDAFDADDDAIDRPERPIPAGLISLRASFTVGFGFLMLAMAIPLIYLLEQTQRTTCIGWPGFHQEDIWRLAVIWLLAGTILLYDGLLKKTFVAPALMGCCRTLNILLGGAAIFVSWAGGLHTRLIWYAISVGIFVAGITLLARSEAKTTVTRFSLARAALVLVAGLAMIVVSPLIDENSAHLNSASAIGGQFYYILIAVITLPIILRLYYAVHQCTPKAIGNAIVTSLTSLIFFDAAFCLLARPDQPFYAGLVASLVVPVFFLRRLSAQT